MKQKEDQMIKKARAGSAKAGTKKKRAIRSSSEFEKPGIKDISCKSRHLCRVTFRLPKEAAPGAGNVSIVGDFNNWKISESKMKKLANGDFTLTLELPCDREISFRYLIDTNRWEKNWFADKHIPGDGDNEDKML